MNFVASLPMYDLPEIRHATDALWQGISRHLKLHGIVGVPAQLLHDTPVQQLWSDKHLFFSQCCGYDVISRYKEHVQILATPKYNAPGCLNHDYVSLIVVHEDSHYTDISEMSGAVAVINGPESHSGMNALMSLVAPLSNGNQFFSDIKISGGHVHSLFYLQHKHADVASIDSITYSLVKQHRPNSVLGTRVLGTTYLAPAPPYITYKTTSMEAINHMRAALVEAFNDPLLETAKETLLLVGLDTATDSEYVRIQQEFNHNFHHQIKGSISFA